MDKIDIKQVITYLRGFFDKLSTKGVYIVLLLYYAYTQADVPPWAKKIIIGSIAYFLNPIDAIPDLTPVLGMTDDLGILAFGLVTIACYVDDQVRDKALEKLHQVMSTDVDESIIHEVNSWL